MSNVQSLSRVLALVTAALLFGAFTSEAQSGDAPGETQSLRVPREKIPPAPPQPPEKAVESLRPASGLRVELVAHEPMVEVPIVVQFDPDGRLWVVEMRSYMPNLTGTGEDQPVSRISILEDTDGDGRMDQKKIFLDGLVLPRALLLIHDGALICEPPRLWFYPIENDRPGTRVLVAEDFAREADPKLGSRMNPEHAGNSLVLGIDNWIYSLYHPFRYRRVAGRWTREPNPQRVQWGLSQDDFGRLFYTSNSDQLRGDVLPSHFFRHVSPKVKSPGLGLQIAQDQSVWSIRVNPGVNRGYQPDTLRTNGTLAKFTAAGGTCIYRGDALPREFYGNAFVCEPAANVVRRNILTETNGMVAAHNAYDHAEFLASTDELFRPVNLTTGPDGALYVVDMYHGIIEHRVYLTSYLRNQIEDRNLQSVTNRGRIWRIVPDEKRALRPRPALGRAAATDLVAALADPNGWWRDTAQRLLIDRHDPQTIPALQQMVRTHPQALARLHALWALEGLTALDPATAIAALADAHPKIRAAAVRLSEGFLRIYDADSAVRPALLALTNDSAADVRLQLALTLGELVRLPDTSAALDRLAQTSSGLARETAAHVIARATPAAPTNAPTNSATVRQGRALTAAEAKRVEEGRTTYEATCLACHQEHGLGQPGLAPSLVDSEWVTGSSARLIRIVLHGLRGPIKVKGETFEMDMPPLGALEDDQIASVLSYVRRAWGHTLDPVDPEMVKKVRAETETREDAWTQADLLKVP